MTDDIERILSGISGTRGPRPDKDGGSKDGASPEKSKHGDWSASLTMVHQAAEAMRATTAQAQAIEARALKLLQSAREELQSAHAMIQSLQTQLQAAEKRVEDAERRAQEAEEWLRRIHESIISELSAGNCLQLGLISETDGKAQSPAATG